MFIRPNNGLPRALLHWSAALILSLVPALHVAGLPDDRDQPIHITADQALRDEKQGKTVYSGNVHMTQGSLKIRKVGCGRFFDDLGLLGVFLGPGFELDGVRSAVAERPARDPAWGPTA